MRKLFLSMCAFALATVAMAQENFALNCEVTASSNTDAAKNVVDGNPATGWQSDYNADAPEQTLIIDLGGVKEFDLIQILWEAASAKRFKILVSNDKNFNDATTFYETEVDINVHIPTQNLKVDTPVKARYVKFIGQAYRLTYGYYIWEFRVMKDETRYLNSIKVSADKAIYAIGEEVELTVNGFDQFNEPINTGNVTYSTSPDNAGTFNGNVFVPAVDGDITLTAHAGDKTAETTVFTHKGSDITKPDGITLDEGTLDKDMTNAFDKKESGDPWVLHTNSDDFNYEVGFTMDLGKEYSVSMVSICFEGACSAAYTIEFSKDNENWKTAATVTHPDGINSWKDRIKAFEGDAEASAVRYIRFKSTKAATQYGVKIREFTVYDGEAAVIKNVEMADNATEKGVWKLTGKAKTVEDINECLTDVNKVVYDLTDVALNIDNVTLTVSNPNAIIIITEEQKAKFRNEQKNLFKYTDGSKNWFTPFEGEKLYLTDGYPVLNAWFYSLGSQGYEYTRELTAGKYVTTYLPATTTLPEGVYAYTFNSYEEGTYKFKKLDGNLVAKTPYILYVSKDATLTCGEKENANNLDFRATNETSVNVENLIFHGTYHFINGDGTQYALYNNTNTEKIELKKFVEGSTIGAFRAYFTLNSTEAKDIKFVFDNGTVDGITNINTEASAKAACIYSIDGCLVNTTGVTENLKSGLYIVNGKKVFVK